MASTGVMFIKIEHAKGVENKAKFVFFRAMFRQKVFDFSVIWWRRVHHSSKSIRAKGQSRQRLGVGIATKTSSSNSNGSRLKELILDFITVDILANIKTRTVLLSGTDVGVDKTLF